MRGELYIIIMEKVASNNVLVLISIHATLVDYQQFCENFAENFTRSSESLIRTRAYNLSAQSVHFGAN